jgi:hypothetical protein
MARITRLFLATVCMLTFAEGAGARSVEKMADTPKAEQHSLLHFGKPLDCKVDTCPKKEEEVAAPAPVKTDKPLVDAYGMPTNLPTLIRGSETAQEVVLTTPRKAKPAASESTSSETKTASKSKTASKTKTASAPAKKTNSEEAGEIKSE